MNTVSTPKPPREVSEIVNVDICDICGNGFTAGHSYAHCHPSETNEAPVEASFVQHIVSVKPNYTRSLEEFDELFPDGVMIEYDEKSDAWEIDVTKKVKSFLKSSIERARREERRRIKDIIWNYPDGLVAAKLIKEISL